MKKLYIETLGCAMNVRDSEHIVAELTTKKNYCLTNSSREADLIIINTCSVREKPVSKLFSEIGKFNKTKKTDAKIGVCGCTASHLGAEIIKRAPAVNFVLGARNVSKISEIVDKNRAVEVDINHDESEFAFSNFRTSSYKSFINISIGCDKKCSFCIVPNTRGDEISIPLNLILDEVKKSVAMGAKEIFLLGQNVNNYGVRFSNPQLNKSLDFTDLLELVTAIDGVERVRFTSPHPLHMDDRFLEVFAKNPKICKSMHMPLQSGSTKILKSMKRGYSKEWFLNRAKKLRTLVPNVHITTDIIVGFPDETDEDFADTMEIIEKVRFEQIFSFKYSPRPFTTAIEFENVVPEEVASQRLTHLQKTHLNMLEEISALQKDKILKVYFEELRRDGMIAGRDESNFVVVVDGSEELLGKIKKVKIVNPRRVVLEGEIV